MRRLFFVLFIMSLTMVFGCQGTLSKAEKNVQEGFVQKVLNRMDEYTPKSLDMKKKETQQEETATAAAQPTEKYVEPVVKKAPDAKYSVTIQPEPKDSTVRIMNIDSRYYPGISLPAGIYDVLVQRKGYKSYREWLNIEYDIILKVILKKSAEAYMAKKIDTSKKVILPSPSKPKLKPQANPADAKTKKTIMPQQKKQLTKKAEVVLPQQEKQLSAETEKAVLPRQPEDLTKETGVITEEVLFPASLLAHTGSINSLCFSPDGSLLASGGYDHNIIIWQVKDGSILQKFNHGDRVKDVSFSPDGNTIASAGSDKMIKLWDIKTGKLQKTLKGHGHRVYSIAFSQDGDTIVSGSNNELYIWDAQTGKTKYFIIGDGQLYPRFGPIHAIAFNPNGKDAQGYDLIFSCAKGIAFFNTANKKMDIIKDTVMPHSATFSPDGKNIAWGARHQHNESEYFPRIASVDAKAIDDSLTKDHELAAADRVFYTAFTPAGNKLVMISYGQAVLYDVKTQSIIRNFTGTSESSVTDAALSPDGHVLAATSRNLIRFWKLDE